MRKCEVFKKIRGARSDVVIKVGTVKIPPKGSWKKGLLEDAAPDNLPLATHTIAAGQYSGSAGRAAIVHKTRQPQGASRYSGDDE